MIEQKFKVGETAYIMRFFEIKKLPSRNVTIWVIEDTIIAIFHVVKLLFTGFRKKIFLRRKRMQLFLHY